MTVENGAFENPFIKYPENEGLNYVMQKKSHFNSEVHYQLHKSPTIILKCFLSMSFSPSD